MSDALPVTPKFKKWIFSNPDDDIVDKLQAELKIHRTLCKLLVNREITDFDSAKRFFRPSYEHLHDPFLMKDMDKAVDRVVKALNNKEKILVYGDYDVDGTTAVSLVYSFLKQHNADAQYYIPDRYKEGYGISSQGIDFAKENNCSLIIALDCGIKAVDKVDYANSLGIDFIICDHHLPDEKLPEALAVLDPKRSDCDYPYKELSGCGLGFKLVEAVSLKEGFDLNEVYELLDYVVVSIAADIVPITGENRVLAYFGMQKINNNPRPGLLALLNSASVDLAKEMEITDLVFTIGPRINAAGRIKHGSFAVDLLVEQDAQEAKEKAMGVQDNNTTRQTLDKDITLEALTMVQENLDSHHKKATVLFKEDWHKGVIGIVASRLIEHFYRPTIVLTLSNGLAVGSGRSVPGFDLHSAIESCKEYLVQFGGHKYAAGLSLLPENILPFTEAFEKVVAERIEDSMLVPHIEIDGVIELEEIDEKFYRIIEQMAPFGPGNMKPIFVTKNVKDAGYTRIVGESHLKLHVSKPNQPAKSGIGFGMWDYIPYIRSKSTFDICYQLYVNEWNGQKNIEIRLKDLK